MKNSVEAYTRAQRALVDIKVAIHQLLEASDGLTNAEIGRALGIYHGHKGHEGHIPRTLLAIMEEEGVAKQDATTKRWYLVVAQALPGNAAVWPRPAARRAPTVTLVPPEVVEPRLLSFPPRSGQLRPQSLQ